MKFLYVIFATVVIHSNSFSFGLDSSRRVSLSVGYFLDFLTLNPIKADSDQKFLSDLYPKIGESRITKSSLLLGITYTHNKKFVFGGSIGGIYIADRKNFLYGFDAKYRIFKNFGIGLGYIYSISHRYNLNQTIDGKDYLFRQKLEYSVKNLNFDYVFRFKGKSKFVVEFLSPIGFFGADFWLIRDNPNQGIVNSTSVFPKHFRNFGLKISASL